MNKNAIIGLIVAVIVGALGFVLFSGSDSNTSGDINSAAVEFTGVAEIDEYLEAAERGEVVDATGQTEVSLSINDFVFDQQVVQVSPGTTVTWTNEGNIRHNVVSWENSPNQGLSSELLANGESYSYTFDEAGTYVYICTPHPLQMRAVVEVVES